ncbi:hypothetical protein BDV59DRAFT_89567 [Aspergillus ambiguus]|uniref:uncharacterized protein n=1 Tax=Aspergillus ambiguus TaxID=176160 RepID=UPI003CCDC8F5
MIVYPGNWQNKKETLQEWNQSQTGLASAGGGCVPYGMDTSQLSEFVESGPGGGQQLAGKENRVGMGSWIVRLSQFSIDSSTWPVLNPQRNEQHPNSPRINKGKKSSIKYPFPLVAIESSKASGLGPISVQNLPPSGSVSLGIKSRASVWAMILSLAPYSGPGRRECQEQEIHRVSVYRIHMEFSNCSRCYRQTPLPPVYLPPEL